MINFIIYDPDQRLYYHGYSGEGWSGHRDDARYFKHRAELYSWLKRNGESQLKGRFVEIKEVIDKNQLEESD
jgi:hypothetical protein